MKIERTKNAVKGIVFGTILKLYQIIVPFFIRTAIIYFLGVEYVGLRSLFLSIFQVLNLIELGVGSAIVFSMYKPIAEDDTEKICGMLNLYKRYYRIIGFVILIVGLILCPYVPELVKSNLPSTTNIYVLYLLNLLAVVLLYWVCAHQNSVLLACQRHDARSKIIILLDTIQYIAQFLVLYFYRNYYLYIIIYFITQILINIAIAIFVKKRYPEYKACRKLDANITKQVKQRIKDLFTTKIDSVIVSSADSIIISACLGLTVLAIYQNYYHIIIALIEMLNVIALACTAGIGNSLIVENKEKNYIDFKKITYIIAWISGVCVSLLVCVSQTFMELWVGKDLLLEFSAVVFLGIYYYVYEIHAALTIYKDAAGIWNKDRLRLLIKSVINLVLDFILVNIWGLKGIILANILSIALVGIPWLIYNLFTEVFKRNFKEYVLNIVKYLITTIVMVIITHLLNKLIIGCSLITLICKGILCFIVSNIIWCLVYAKTKEMSGTIKLLGKILKI